MNHKTQVIVIGAGIIGLAVAHHLLDTGLARDVIVLEKENDICAHQTGRNSGVIHSGIYYKPGSLKATNCRRGRALLIEFCQQHHIRHEVCGKIIVATIDEERPRLDNLLERGKANGVHCEPINSKRIRELEPAVTQGIAGIRVYDAGIADYVGVGRMLQRFIERDGNGQVLLRRRVESLSVKSDSIEVRCGNGETFHARYAVNCGGLQSDRIAKLSGTDPGAQIVPFRGEYFALKPDKGKHFCRNLIYPVPDPQYPFLGVHLTRMIADGGIIECGPNAVPALAREGYRKTDVNFDDVMEMLRFSGFRRMALKHWRMGMGEIWRSINKQAFVRALQRLVPDLRANDLEEAPAGIRAQLILPTGDMVDDFLFVEGGERMLHVCNAPSPAATSALSIAETVAQRLMQLPSWRK